MSSVTGNVFFEDRPLPERWSPFKESWNPIFGQRIDWLRKPSIWESYGYPNTKQNNNETESEERLPNPYCAMILKMVEDAERERVEHFFKELMNKKLEEISDSLGMENAPKFKIGNETKLEEVQNEGIAKEVNLLNQRMTHNVMEEINGFLKLGYICNIKQETPTKISFEFSKVKKNVNKFKSPDDLTVTEEQLDKFHKFKPLEVKPVEEIKARQEYVKRLINAYVPREELVALQKEAFSYPDTAQEDKVTNILDDYHSKVIQSWIKESYNHCLPSSNDETEEEHESINLVGVDHPTDELPNSFKERVFLSEKERELEDRYVRKLFEQAYKYKLPSNENWIKLSEQQPDQYAIVNVKFTDLIGKEYTYYEVSLENCCIDSNKSIWITKPDYLNKLKSIQCSEKIFHCKSIFIPVNTASWKICGDIRNHYHSLIAEEILKDNQPDIEPDFQPEIKTPLDKYEPQKHGFICADDLLPDENATVELLINGKLQKGNLVVWESEKGNKYYKLRNVYVPLANRYEPRSILWKPLDGETIQSCLPEKMRFEVGDYFIGHAGLNGCGDLILGQVKKVETNQAVCTSTLIFATSSKSVNIPLYIESVEDKNSYLIRNWFDARRCTKITPELWDKIRQDLE